MLARILGLNNFRVLALDDLYMACIVNERQNNIFLRLMSQQHKIYPISYNRSKPPNAHNHQHKDNEQHSNVSATNCSQINGDTVHKQQKSCNNLPEQIPQQIVRQTSQSAHLCLQVAHSQQIQAMERQFQSVIRGYQTKLRTINEEYRRCKHEMESKIKELFREKNHWFNLATSSNSQYSQIQNRQNFSRNIQKCDESYEERACQDQFAKQKQTIDMLQKQKNKLLEQKQQILKSIEKLNLENNSLKDRINEDAKQVIKLKYQIRQHEMMSQKSDQKQYRDHRNFNHKTPPRKTNSTQAKKQSSPVKQSSHNNFHPNLINIHPQALRDLEFFKLSNDKYRYLVSSLNQELILSKLKHLNQKYQKNPCIAYNSGVSKGFVYPLNVVSTGRRASQCYNSFQGN